MMRRCLWQCGVAPSSPRRLFFATAASTAAAALSTSPRSFCFSRRKCESDEEGHRSHDQQQWGDPLDAASQEKRGVMQNRKVVFAAGSSSDSKPDVAAREAFNIAACALPSPPNFAFVVVSQDNNETMVDAPSTVWSALCEVNALSVRNVMRSLRRLTTPQFRSPNNNIALIAGSVRDQRPEEGCVRVLVGCIPDLEATAFALDASAALPTLSKPPFLCVTAVDCATALADVGKTNAELCRLSAAFPCVPVVGGMYAPAHRDEPSTSEHTAGSAFWFNGQQFKGGAGGIVLGSDMVESVAVSISPSWVLVEDAEVTKMSPTVPNVIAEINCIKATDFIKKLYEKPPLSAPQNAQSNVTLKLIHRTSSRQHALSFVGNPEDGTLVLDANPCCAVKEKTKLEIVMDKLPDDIFGHAEMLVAAKQRVFGGKSAFETSHVSVKASGAAPGLLVSSTGALMHWSYPGLDEVFHNVSQVALDPSTYQPPKRAPSIPYRVLGHELAVGGSFLPGQILSSSFVYKADPKQHSTNGNDAEDGLNDTSESYLAARSAVYAILRGKE